MRRSFAEAAARYMEQQFVYVARRRVCGAWVSSRPQASACSFVGPARVPVATRSAETCRNEHSFLSSVAVLTGFSLSGP